MSQPRNSLRRTVKRGLVDGAMLALTTTAALLVVSAIECGSPWAAVNPICHIVDGDEREFGSDFNLRDSTLGVAVSSSVMLGWGVLHSFVFGRVMWPRSIAAGLVTAAGTYAIDYWIVPKRFTPGIEQKLGRNSIAAVYAVLGATLAVAALRPSARD